MDKHFFISNQEEAYAKIAEEFPDLVDEFHRQLLKHSKGLDSSLFFCVLTDQPLNADELETDKSMAHLNGWSYLVAIKEKKGVKPLFGIFLCSDSRMVHPVLFETAIVRH